MNDKQLMQSAAEKIQQLRRENEVLRAKVDTMDLMASLFFGSPPRNGMGGEEDVAHLLSKRAVELDLEQRKRDVDRAADSSAGAAGVADMRIAKQPVANRID